MVCHGAWVKLEEVEVGDCWVEEIAAEAANVNLSWAIQIKVAHQLVIHSLTNDNSSTIFKFKFQVLERDFRVVWMQVDWADKILDLLLCLQFLGNAQLELL